MYLRQFRVSQCADVTRRNSVYVTGVCFWHVKRDVNHNNSGRSTPCSDFWASVCVSFLQEELLATCSIQPGFVCNRKDIANDKKAFVGSGIFHDVRANVVKRDGKVSPLHTTLLTLRRCIQFTGACKCIQPPTIKKSTACTLVSFRHK